MTAQTGASLSRPRRHEGSLQSPGKVSYASSIPQNDIGIHVSLYATSYRPRKHQVFKNPPFLLVQKLDVKREAPKEGTPRIQYEYDCPEFPILHLLCFWGSLFAAPLECF